MSTKFKSCKLSGIQEMEALIFLLLVTMSSIFLSVSGSNLESFLQCLPQHVQPSNPISDVIFTQNHSNFQSVLNAYIKNLKFLIASTPKPLAILTAKHESHVQATVICAKQAGLELRIRSGGHDYDGLSYISTVPFVILDMFNLRSIDIDIAKETAWVQAGATLGELYFKIANTSKVHAFPAGVCHSLGVGGHISGGGYGNLLRKYGISVDNVIDAQLVDVKGRVLNREFMGEDLFWAIRGGGGASFGVILAWKIKLVAVPEKVTLFKVDKTLGQGATDVLYKWQYVAPKLPEELFVRAMIQVPKEEKTVSVSFVGFFLGQTESLMKLMNQKFPEVGLQPNDCHEMSWGQSTVFFFDSSQNVTSIDVLLQRPTEAKISFKAKSDYVKDVIPREGLEEIWKKMIDNENMFMQWNPYGGRMSEILESETAFPHRAGNLFLIQYYESWPEEGIDATNLYTDKLRDFYDSMAPYVSSNPRNTYLNYRDLDIGISSNNQTSLKDAEVYGTKYFNGNFKKLVEVKTRFDPDNFFKNEQSIPPGNLN